jgi:hypothetical protein
MYCRWSWSTSVGSGVIMLKKHQHFSAVNMTDMLFQPVQGLHVKSRIRFSYFQPHTPGEWCRCSPRKQWARIFQQQVKSLIFFFLRKVGRWYSSDWLFISGS